MLKISRRPTTQDISWFLDQYKAGRLDLDPPYQRRSVWTSKDRRYFLDTLFRGYPCPPIYLHKTIDKTGTSIFHVIDGKQRIETLIRFAEGRLRVPENYGDERLNNKRWKDILHDTPLRNQFLNYAFVVEYFDEVDVDSTVVNEIFERMNKNSRKLTQQELRNARYDGWFSSEVEREVDEPIWKKLGIVTTGRARRMADVQFIAELFMIILHQKIVGFDHALIDQTYADYEDPENPDLAFDREKFAEALSNARAQLTQIYDAENGIADFLSSVSNMYTLWATLVLDREKLPPLDVLSNRYHSFARQVMSLAAEMRKNLAASQEGAEVSAAKIVGGEPSQDAIDYFNANQSATTELPQRNTRLTALRKALQIEDR